MKLCPKCQHEFPETEEFFYKNKPSVGGFVTPCRQCRLAYKNTETKKRREIRRKAIADRTTKICLGCKQNLPLAFFSKCRVTKRDGLASRCRQCISKQHKITYPVRRARVLKYLASYYNTFDGAMRHTLCAARSRAKKLGRPCTIDLPYLFHLWDVQGGKCAITGIQLDYGWNKFSTDRQRPASRRHPHNMSLDRINNSLGYIPGNVRFVTIVVNLALNNFGEAVFDEMCKSRIAKLQGLECKVEVATKVPTFNI